MTEKEVLKFARERLRRRSRLRESLSKRWKKVLSGKDSTFIYRFSLPFSPNLPLLTTIFWQRLKQT